MHRVVIVLAATLTLVSLLSCSTIRDSGESQSVSHSVFCVLAVCETADRTDRAANQESVEGGLNKSELQELENTITSEQEAKEV